MNAAVHPLTYDVVKDFAPSWAAEQYVLPGVEERRPGEQSHRAIAW
jgi:hypothetical protein